MNRMTARENAFILLFEGASKNDETPDRGGKAIKKMPDAMIEAQSYDVDGISGATRTSDGIKDAVARALEDASKDTNN